MAKSEADYASLVDTLDIPLEATTDIETLRDWIRQNVARNFSDVGLENEVEALWRGVQYKYDVLPQLDLGVSTFVQYRGTLREAVTTRYRDLVTGRFVSAADVSDVIGGFLFG